MFHEMDRKMAELREVEAIKPDHWSRTVLAMIVPVPSRCEDHIAALHGHATAVHSSEASIALDYETHRKSHMAMGWSGLVGHDKLQAGVYSIRSIRRIC